MAHTRKLRSEVVVSNCGGRSLMRPSLHPLRDTVLVVADLQVRGGEETCPGQKGDTSPSGPELGMSTDCVRHESPHM